MTVLANRQSDALSYFNNNELPAKVFLDKYALKDKHNVRIEHTPDHMHKRIANEIARVEKKKFRKPLTARQIYHCLKDFKYIIPQGSPMYGIGNSAYVTLSNCYTLPPVLDSYAGIHYTDQQITQISKRRGGVGFDISELRPVDMSTSNSSGTTTGIIPFMKRFSNSIREVGQNGRRGAMMMTISVHHPQVYDFTTIKKNLLEITGANLSIRLSNEFLNAVESNTEYEQRWPVEGTPKISKKVSARAVWNTIIHSAHSMAEPGLLFWDRITSECPADCYAEYGFKTVGVNPCSELNLSALDSCRLLCLNLFSFVANPFSSAAKFLYKKFTKYCMVAQRLMDDIIDLELECINRIIDKIQSDPEPNYIKVHELDTWQKIKANCANGRRTGTGITALGDTLAALGVPYGSEESVKVTNDIYRTLKLGCYQSSVEMAKEIGSFPFFNAELETEQSFLLRIKEDDSKLYAEMQKHGRRNIALLTTAPTGTTSLLAGPGPYFGTTSGGEPAFMMSHIRKKKINHNDTDTPCDYVDASGDKWQEFSVVHPKLQLWKDITGETDERKSPYYGSCAEDINWKQRVKMQGTAQRHVDHAISSTINLPENVSEEEVATIYMAAWKEGCKGMTVYRKNCRDGVMIEHKESCPGCKGKNIIVKQGKCVSCQACGWSACSI